MNMLKTFVIAAAVAAFTLPLPAQEKHVSPHETGSKVIDGNRITITYGRPLLKDPRTGANRKIWGGLVPYGKVWRAGADEATTLITEKPLVFGTLTVPAGAYSLYMQPEENGPSKLIISKEIGQWGMTYHADQDLGRVDLKREEMPNPAEQLIITTEPNPAGGGTLVILWANLQYSAPFTVQK